MTGMIMANTAYYYTASALGAGAPFEDKRLEACLDRHRIDIAPPALRSSDSLVHDALSSGACGLVVEMEHGWPSRVQLKLARGALRSAMRVWFYWPGEGAVEFIDKERYGSYKRLAAFVVCVKRMSDWRQQFRQFCVSAIPPLLKPIIRFAYLLCKKAIRYLVRGPSASSAAAKVGMSEQEEILARIIASAKPVPLSWPAEHSGTGKIMHQSGAYLRLDFWAPINTGGSYGHTCYVAKELAATTADFTCFMANRFALLDEMGVAQHVLAKPGPSGDEVVMINANAFYYDLLAKKMLHQRPAYIYERLCLGSFVGARLSQELGIPYIVEYNGSEISIRHSFSSGSFEYEQLFLKAEEAAFSQATIISVISEAVRDDLLKRGIAAEKILVNPNGVDMEAYTPTNAVTRNLLRKEFGFAPADRVIGFIGTFGGWHGIDTLAEAIPEICQRNSTARFLLIGDGNCKALIDDTVSRHKLGKQVVCTGRVPHQKGAQLLGICDIYVAPHNSHMVDSRFFGSPTKLFEYMAMGGGIVASALEQIGEVLSPSIQAGSQLSPSLTIKNERSILCAPGSVAEFVEAVLFLVEHPQICEALGRNARQAADSDYSWRKHIDRLWEFGARLTHRFSDDTPAVMHQAKHD